MWMLLLIDLLSKLIEVDFRNKSVYDDVYDNFVSDGLIIEISEELTATILKDSLIYITSILKNRNRTWVQVEDYELLQSIASTTRIIGIDKTKILLDCIERLYKIIYDKTGIDYLSPEILMYKGV